MCEYDIGVLLICGDDDWLYGMFIDCDIVIKGLVVGLDLNIVMVGELVWDSIYYVDVNVSI